MDGKPDSDTDRTVREVMADRYEQLAALPWRQGRSLGRTIYAVTGADYLDHILIGVMDSESLAEAACSDHNRIVHGLGRR